MSSSSSVDQYLRPFLEGVWDAQPGHGAFEVAAGTGAMGAGLASMTLGKLADESAARESIYDAGRAHELGQLGVKFLTLIEAEAELERKLAKADDERRAALQVERTELTLEVAEAAISCQRILGMTEALDGAEAQVAIELSSAAGRAAIHLGRERAAAIQDPAVRDLRLETADLLARQLESGSRG